MQVYPNKAGMIPYMFDENGKLRMLFMVSSDPKYGGPRPMISKGNIDEGEDDISAAIREANEELGLRTTNMLEMPWSFFSEQVKLSSSTYHLVLFACMIYSANQKDFDAPHYETKYTKWMSLEEFQLTGRPDHKPIVEKLVKNICDRFDIIPPYCLLKNGY